MSLNNYTKNCDLSNLKELLLSLQKLSIKIANTPIPSGSDISRISNINVNELNLDELEQELELIKTSFSKIFPNPNKETDPLLREVSQFIKNLSSQVKAEGKQQYHNSDDIQREQCPEVFADIIEMVSLELEQKQSKIEEFINKISDGISSANDIANNSNDFSQKHTDNISTMDKNINENISTLTSMMHDNSQDPNLSKKLKGSISQLTSTINKYKEREDALIKENEEKIRTLRNKLNQAKQETDTLKKHLQEQKILARKDVLTELPNRIAYYDKLQEEINKIRAGEEGQLYIAVADIDHFKKLNDTYGHLTGDNVLKQVAKILRVGLQLNDFIGRFGGEEFVILLRDRTPEKAYKILDNIRDNLSKIPFHYRDTNKNEKIPITISIGISQFKVDDNEEECFKRADAALYEAKKTRNQVVYFN